MVAFRVIHNGTEVCTASVGPVGVLMAGLTWVRRVGDVARIPANESEQVECSLKVHALHSPTNEHRTWDCHSGSSEEVCSTHGSNVGMEDR
jgi:hypothetical protein